MSKRDDGGPAFPREEVVMRDGTRYGPVQPGMSLRDWFAGQALAGLCAAQVSPSVVVVVEEAYQLADAMLAARKEPGA